MVIDLVIHKGFRVEISRRIHKVFNMSLLRIQERDNRINILLYIKVGLKGVYPRILCCKLLAASSLSLLLPSMIVLMPCATSCLAVDKPMPLEPSTISAIGELFMILR